MLGTALEKCCHDRDLEVHAPPHQAIDVCRPNTLIEVLQEVRPTHLINCVAMVGIDPCEKDPGRAFELHSTAALNMAKICRDLSITLVQTSTHAVFDGRKDRPYTENDEPLATNAYSGSKLIAEHFVSSLTPKHFIIRYPTMFGPRRNASMGFADKMIGLMKSGATVRVAKDKMDSLSYTKDVASRTIDLCVESHPYGLYHVANAGYCSFFDFVVRLRDKLKLPAKIEPNLDADFPSIGFKPLRTAIASSKLPPLRSWESALEEYVKDELNG